MDILMDAKSVCDDPDSDILRRYKEKLLLEEQKHQLDHTSTEYQQSLQMLRDANIRVEIQVNDYMEYDYN